MEPQEFEQYLDKFGEWMSDQVYFEGLYYEEVCDFLEVDYEYLDTHTEECELFVTHKINSKFMSMWLLFSSYHNYYNNSDLSKIYQCKENFSTNDEMPLYDHFKIVQTIEAILNGILWDLFENNEIAIDLKELLTKVIYKEYFKLNSNKEVL